MQAPFDKTVFPNGVSRMLRNALSLTHLNLQYHYDLQYDTFSLVIMSMGISIFFRHLSLRGPTGTGRKPPRDSGVPVPADEKIDVPGIQKFDICADQIVADEIHAEKQMLFSISDYNFF
jgi:hypothetical protein